MPTNITLSEREIEKETMLSCMIERQHSTPSEKNLRTMFNVLKDCSVYVPVKLIVSKEEEKKIIDAIKNNKPVPQTPNMKVAPQLLANQKGEKIMPWFSREFEIKSKQTEGISFMRINVSKAVEMADNMPDAFDIVFDLYSHPVKLTLDEVIEGLNAPAPEGANVEADIF